MMNESQSQSTEAESRIWNWPAIEKSPNIIMIYAHSVARVQKLI